MRERLISRVGRIISGGFNAIVDAVENAAPETVMQEAIREVDSAIDDIRAELGKVVARKHLATTKLMDENSKHENLNSQIELAVKEGREDLAEAAVATQLDIEAQIPVLEAAIETCRQDEKELEGYLAALQGKHRQMLDELRQYRVNVTRDASGKGAPPASGASASEAKTSKAEAAFKRAMEGATGIAERQGADATTAAKLAELEDMARKNRIQERMAAIKKEMGN